MLRPKQSRFKKFDPVFHLQGKDSDSKELSSKLIKEARAKGELNLSKKGLGHDFKSHFRIERSTFEVLCQTLGPIYHEDRDFSLGGKPATPLEKQLLSSIWLLVNQEVFRSVADRFDMSKSTLWGCVHRLCSILVDKAADYIKWPSHNESLAHMRDCEDNTGFPGVVGAIDGMHVPILAPCDNATSYINRNKYQSVLLQGVADRNYRFIDCFAVPAKVWRINDLDDEELRQLDVRLDGDGDKWWEPEPLRVLDLSNNAIKVIPGDIRFLQDSLTTLNLDGNCLERLPTEIGHLRHVTHLSIRGNRLKVLPPGFYKMVELTQLSLADNRLESLDGDIADLIMLQKLDLSCNLLTELPPSLGFLTRLTELKVSHNQLTEIPPDLGNLRVLTQLILAHNEISQLPPLGELTKMEVLSLAHNRLSGLPQVLGCVALRELYLQHNEIQDLDEEVFEAMMHLKVLDLQHNKIEMVPEQVCQLRHVVQLNLANNAITTLPAVLCDLPHLRSLQVADNPIQNVRRDIVHCGTQRTLQFLRNSMDRSCELPIASNDLSNPEQTFPDRFAMRGSRSLSLASRGLVTAPYSVFEEAKQAEVVYVDVSNNKLSEPPPGLCVLKDLITELNLSCNLITTVTPCVAELGKLQYLDLQRNCLESLPQELATMLRLRELNISFNRFTALPDCVYSLVGLEILIAENNKLVSIDVASLQQLMRLATLDLRNNDISFVPPELGNLKLKSLELSGNSFRTPRHAILEKGTDSLLSYLRDRIQQ